MEGLYLYGVMPAGTAPSIPGVGLGESDVVGLTYGPFDALLSFLPLKSVTFEADALQAHEQVLLKAMESGTVVPAVFGHLFDSPDELYSHLDSAADDLLTSLEYLSDRVEVGIKAIWRKEAFLADIETDELRELIRDTQSCGADSSMAIHVGEMVETLVTTRRQAYVAEICSKLEVGALRMILNDPVTPRMIFNAAFLLPTDAQKDFFHLAERVLQPYLERVDFHYSGPWPAHNFAKLRISSS